MYEVFSFFGNKVVASHVQIGSHRGCSVYIQSKKNSLLHYNDTAFVSPENTTRPVPVGKGRREVGRFLFLEIFVVEALVKFQFFLSSKIVRTLESTSKAVTP